MKLGSTRSLAWTVAALALAACDDGGPDGPGAFVAFVDGSTVGGVLLEVEGEGIVGFEGLSSTRVYAAPVAGEPGRHRVMAIHPGGEDIRFEIQVEDLDVAPPVAHVLSASGVANGPRLTADIEVRIGR